MRNLSITLLLLFSITFQGNTQHPYSYPNITYAELYKSFQRDYGFDQELINGIFYENFYLKPLGHPFLGQDQFYTGKLVYHHKAYDNVDMKYDIYEQQLVINYRFNDKQLNIILPNEFISEFSFDGKLFRYFYFQEQEPGFYQVISDGHELNFLFHWYKDRRVSYHNRTFSSFEFSNSNKKSYLSIQDNLIPFSNNRTFIKSFRADVQDQIRKFMKSNKIKVRTCNDSTMLKLLNYCNTLAIR
jgi:hypothetical protein